MQILQLTSQLNSNKTYQKVPFYFLLGVVGALVLAIPAQAEQHMTSHIGALSFLVPQSPESGGLIRWKVAAEDTQEFLTSIGTI